MGSISASEPTTGTNKSAISHNKGKKHREGKGQLEGARNFYSIMVVLWKYRIISLNRSVRDLFLAGSSHT